MVCVAGLEGLALDACQQLPQAGNPTPTSPAPLVCRCLHAQGGGGGVVEELGVVGVVAQQVALSAQDVLVHLQQNLFK